MALTVVRHSVRDYAAWRAVYDDFGDAQRAAGVTTQAVYQAADDPNAVLVLHHFATVAEAEAFLALPALREGMERAGIVGTPRIEIYA